MEGKGGGGKEGNKAQPFCAGWLLATCTLNREKLSIKISVLIECG